MLSIQNTILTSGIFKFVGFDSIYICRGEELDQIIQSLRCCMVIANPAENAYGFMQQFLSPLHAFCTDLLYKSGFNKSNFEQILGSSFCTDNQLQVDSAYSELMHAMQEYSDLILDKGEVYTVYNVSNGDFEIKVKSDANVFLVVPTIVSRNSKTGKQSFRILDTSVNRVVDYVEYMSTSYMNSMAYDKLAMKLYGSVKPKQSDDITYRLLRTVDNRLSGLLGYIGISNQGFTSLNSSVTSGNLRVKLCHYLNIGTKEIKAANSRYKHSCAAVTDIENELGVYPWDSFLYSYTKSSTSFDQQFGQRSTRTLDSKEYINGDQVTFYTQVVDNSSIGYSETKPCEQCKYFMNRISTNPRCTFMSSRCEVGYSDTGITAWKNIKYKKENKNARVKS